jgi:hypothetical protein
MRRVDFEHEPTIVFARVALDVDAWLAAYGAAWEAHDGAAAAACDGRPGSRSLRRSADAPGSARPYYCR